MMADNYLEKKFEEHLNSASRPVTRRHLPVKERRAVVTGGAKGIGAAIVRSLRVAGHKVAFCDIDEAAGADTALRTGAEFFCVDVADADAFRSFLRGVESRWGGVDIIINNVAVKQPAPLLEATVEQFDRAMAVDVRPVLIGAQEMARMRSVVTDGERPYGRIVNICSSRQRQSLPGNDIHAAAKGAIFSLTHSLAISLSAYGVTVNSISPGMIATADYDNVPPAIHAQHPSGRVGRPDDVARLIRFLIDEANDFVNAENIVVDGGLTRKMAFVP